MLAMGEEVPGFRKEDAKSAPKELVSPPPREGNDKSIKLDQGTKTNVTDPSDPKETLASDSRVGNSLHVVSWGGAYGDMLKRTLFSAFQKKTGAEIQFRTWDGKTPSSLDSISQERWDAVTLPAERVAAACQAGKLLPLTDLWGKADTGPGKTRNIGSGKTEVTEDFLPGARQRCGLAASMWSLVVLYDSRAFRHATPKALADFFDPNKFPGKRALPKDPRRVMEMALLADGVSPEAVYATLATDEGISRALKKLTALKPHIVWWQRGREAISLLETKAVSLALAYNGRAFHAIAGKRLPFRIVWDGQIYTFDMWAIPQTARNPLLAKRFLAFALDPESQATQARWLPYGPVRRSAVARVGKHPALEKPMTPFLPSAPKNFQHALAFDANWWRERGQKAKRRFQAWLKGEDSPSPEGTSPPDEMGNQTAGHDASSPPTGEK